MAVQFWAFLCYPGIFPVPEINFLPCICFRPYGRKFLYVRREKSKGSLLVSQSGLRRREGGGQEPPPSGGGGRRPRRGGEGGGLGPALPAPAGDGEGPGC